MYLSILILPLLGSIISGFMGRKIGVTGAHIITCTCLFLSAILATIAFYEVGICGSSVFINLGKWINSDFIDISWEFLFDQLTVSMFSNQLNLLKAHLVPILIINPKINILKPKYNFSITTCTALVLWNTPNSRGYLQEYLANSFIRNYTGLPSFHLGVIIGL